MVGLVTENLILFLECSSIAPSIELIVNFGFKNCSGVSDIKALKDVYKEMVQKGCAHEELSQAMLSNELFNLAKKYELEGGGWSKLKRRPRIFRNHRGVEEED